MRVNASGVFTVIAAHGHDLQVANLKTGSFWPLSGIPALLAGNRTTPLSALVLSTPPRYAAYTAPVLSDASRTLYAVQADGGNAPVRIGPDVADPQTITQFAFINDFLLAVRSDPVRGTRTCVSFRVLLFRYSSESHICEATNVTSTRMPGTPLTNRSLPAQNTVTLSPSLVGVTGDPLASFGNVALSSRFAFFHVGGATMAYTMRYPDAVNSSLALYAMSVAGGDTVRVSWGSSPSAPVLIGYTPLVKSFNFLLFGDSSGANGTALGFGADAYIVVAVAARVAVAVVSLLCMLVALL